MIYFCLYLVFSLYVGLLYVIKVSADCIEQALFKLTSARFIRIDTRHIFLKLIANHNLAQR